VVYKYISKRKINEGDNIMKTYKSKISSSCNSRFVFSCVLAMLISTFTFLLCGCGSKQYRVFGGRKVGQKGQISKEELREELNNFEEFWTDRYGTAMVEIEEFMPDVRTRNTTLRLRVRIPEALHTMLEHQDPIIAFIETWGLCLRTTQYFESGAGSRFFGEHQDIIIRAAKDIETEMERIGQLFLNENMFNETRSNIRTFAGANQIKDTYTNAVVYATAIKQDQPNPFVETISLPLAPFRAMEGVDRGAVAINRFTDTAQNFTDIVERLPETTKWQMQLLFYDLEETDTIKSFVESTQKISDSSVKLVQTTENLPQRIREEATILIQEIDEKQQNIKTTLQQAETTAVAVESALQNSVKAANAFDDTADTITSTINALDGAAKSTTEAVLEIQQLIPKREPGTEPSFKITDVRDAAVEVANTANEIRTVTADLSALLASDDLDRLTSVGQKMTNLVTWRITFLIVFAFALALGYRFLVVRYAPVKK
jgi:methyl-accepting chemotaxis protein